MAKTSRSFQQYLLLTAAIAFASAIVLWPAAAAAQPTTGDPAPAQPTTEDPPPAPPPAPPAPEAPPPAPAAEDPAPEQPAPSEESQEDADIMALVDLEETIIITGTSRARGAHDTPLAVQSRDALDLARLGVSSQADVLNSVPTIKAEGGGGEVASNVFIRGLPLGRAISVHAAHV